MAAALSEHDGHLAAAPGRLADIVTGVNSVAVKPRETRLVIAGVVAFAAVVVSWVVYDVVSGKGGALNPVDLTVYRDGGLIVRHVRPYYDPHAGHPLYDWGGYSSLALKFTYTPFAAVAFAVVSFIPMKALEVLSVIVNIASLLVALWFTLRALGYADRRVRFGAMLVAAGVTFWLQPVVRTIYLGQINLLLMAGIIWDLTQPEFTTNGKRRWWAGAVTGVAAGIKLVPLIFIPYLVLTKRFREAAMNVAGFAVTVAIGFAFLPNDSSQWWLHGMIFNDGNRTGFTGWAGNQSLRGLITRLSGSINAGTKPYFVAGFVAVVVGILAAVLIDRAGHRMAAILTVALTGLLFSPISWDHHWVWVAPGVVVVWHYTVRAWRAGEKWRARWLAAIGAGIIFVFAAWPDAIWENGRYLSKFSLGFLWAQKNTSPKEFSQHGDKPQYVEYHWHGFQLLWGNIYILAGMALMLILAGIAIRLRHAAPAPPDAAPSELPASVPASLPGAPHPLPERSL
jgi:alpha-1,2-mannosyltransferase